MTESATAFNQSFTADALTGRGLNSQRYRKVKQTHYPLRWQVQRLCVTMEEMKLEVDCYSGRTADERPVRFRLEDCQYMVEEVLDQWYGTQDAFYKVRADDGNLYILRRETSTPDGVWHLESFRQLP